MFKALKVFLSPTFLIVGVALILGFGLATGRLNLLPRVASAEECQPIDNEQVCQLISECDGPCQEVVDVCLNLDGNQATVPTGYHTNNNGDCVVDPVPQVLGESTTADDPGPQVLADFTGK